MLINDNSSIIVNGIKVMAIGWLDCAGVPSISDCALEVIAKTRSVLANAEELGVVIDRFRSCRTCPVCNNFRGVISDGRPVGFQNIAIPGLVLGEYWFFPDLLVHYFEVHNYGPPEEFIEALRKFERPLLQAKVLRAAIGASWLEERSFSPVPHTRLNTQ